MSVLRFRYEGVAYEVDVVQHGDRISITHSGRTYEVELDPGRPSALGVATLGASTVPVTVPAAPAPTAPTAPAGPTRPASAGPGVLPAPMTGSVKEIKVTEGQAVAAGDLVVVMEAMKMDIDVYAQADGVVAKLHVSAGDNVADNQALVTIQ